MQTKTLEYRTFLFVMILIIILACNLPAGTSIPPSNASNPATPAKTQPPTIIAETPTAPVVHLTTPAEVTPSGTLFYDVESSGTASEHRAPYGDSYNINRFERPFTQLDMSYVPALDIVTLRMGQDDNWYYPFVELIGGNVNDPLNINYGIEIDKDRDGHGEVLIWAHPPYTTQWSADTVQAYTDTNHDTGGPSLEKSDAPYAGNGYDTLIESGNMFMWGAWSDAGLRDPAKFNYNDRFTIEEAGSPLTDNTNYPIKALYLVDNTCRAAFGFNPTGDEPLICPTEPKPTKAPHVPGTPPPQGCQPPSYCVAPDWVWHSDICECWANIR